MEEYIKYELFTKREQDHNQVICFIFSSLTKFLKCSFLVDLQELYWVESETPYTNVLKDLFDELDSVVRL